MSAELIIWPMIIIALATIMALCSYGEKQVFATVKRR